jgi:hypothetical protein
VFGEQYVSDERGVETLLATDTENGGDDHGVVDGESFEHVTTNDENSPGSLLFLR